MFPRDHGVAKGGMIIEANRTKIRRVSKYFFEFIREIINIYMRLIATHCNKSSDTQLGIM
jgi:hypothetical protein